MNTPFTCVKRAAMFSGMMLWIFSAYAQTVVSPPIIVTPIPDSIHACTISGTVFTENCPANPAMGMPCTLSPVSGATVTICPDYYMTNPVPGAIYNMPAILCQQATTDKNGNYSITIEAEPTDAMGINATVSATKAGVGASTPVNVSLVKDTTIVNLTLQDVVVTPPPTQGTATLQGTVSAAASGVSNGPMVPAIAQTTPVPQCTVVVTPMVVPMIYPTPPQYLPQTAVTDANGHYALTLSAGDYMVSAQKSGLGSAQANVTLTANQTTTQDLILIVKDSVPVSPVGKANIIGTVKEVINPPNPLMGMASVLQPVPGCTVLVCAAVLPIIYNQNVQAGATTGSAGSAATTSTSNAPAVLTAQQFIAITDADGNYSFKNIPIYGTTYSVVLMAKKGLKFGSTQADLSDGQTVTANIIIGEVAPVTPPDTAVILPGIYQQYYDAVANTLVPQNPTAVIMHSSSTANAAVTARISGNSLFITLPESQRLTVRAFALNGEVIATIASNRFFASGENVLPALVKYSGPMLIQVRGENVSYIVKVSSLRHR